MPRKYAVLKQFIIDFDRLLRDAEAAAVRLRGRASPTQAELLDLYRPIHSLKGICGMVEATKPLVRAFHSLEDALPPLLPLQSVAAAAKRASHGQAAEVARSAFRLAREVEKLLRAKLELWEKLGADEHESQGLIVSFTQDGAKVRAWVGVTSIVGLTDAVQASAGNEAATVGSGADAEALIIEVRDGSVVVLFDGIEATCTRAEAIGRGVSQTFKEWWIRASAPRRGSSAA